MSKVRVSGFSLSLDGFGAGPDQDLENPLGKRGKELHEWFFPTRTFKKMIGAEGGETGVDDELAVRASENVGANVLGRNMFGPVRGPWKDDTWKGWWGDEPPYHTPVFVLTHHPRASIEMKGGTIFHFVTEGIEDAVRRAKEAAAGRDVRIGGGVATVRQALHAGLVDEMHLAFSPVLLGRGESLFQGMDLAALGFEVVEHVPGKKVTHAVFRRAR